MAERMNMGWGEGLRVGQKGVRFGAEGFRDVGGNVCSIDCLADIGGNGEVIYSGKSFP
jgi:hypothetical protein